MSDDLYDLIQRLDSMAEPVGWDQTPSVFSIMREEDALTFDDYYQLSPDNLAAQYDAIAHSYSTPRHAAGFAAIAEAWDYPKGAPRIGDPRDWMNRREKRIYMVVLRDGRMLRAERYRDEEDLHIIDPVPDTPMKFGLLHIVKSQQANLN